jgi:hydroxymethylbilane synthase
MRNPMSSAPPHTLRLGTRGSLLARTQSGLVAAELMRRHPGLHVELVIIKTSGDRIQNRPLHEFGGKGLFTKEIEQALLAGDVDFAVHSMKDVPVTMPLVDTSDLTFAAIPAREDARDVIVLGPSLAARVATHFDAAHLRTLPSNVRIGTSSLRRRCQLRAILPDAVIEDLRGNIDTRLGKLRDGQYDAIVLALAGLKRAALWDPSVMSPFSRSAMLPAAGQGALALQCRRSDIKTVAALAALEDQTTRRCVETERRLVELLNGDCHSPIAALAEVAGDALTLAAAVGGRDGSGPVLQASATAPVAQAASAAEAVHRQLVAQGAPQIL